MANESKAINVDKKEIQTQDESERVRDTRVFTPRSDIYEENEKIYIIVDMPGTDENSLDITVEKNVLSIEGLVEPGVEGNFTPIYTEYGTGDYQRSFLLSDEIDRNNINARVKDGVLTIELQKSKEAKAKKILVTAQ